MSRNSVSLENIKRDNKWKKLLENNLTEIEDSSPREANVVIIGDKMVGKSSLNRILTNKTCSQVSKFLSEYCYTYCENENDHKPIGTLNSWLISSDTSCFSLVRPSLMGVDNIKYKCALIFAIDLSKCFNSIAFLDEWMKNVLLINKELETMREFTTESSTERLGIVDDEADKQPKNKPPYVFLVANFCDKFESELRTGVFSQDHALAVQYHLRKWCLENGASLSYLSCKTGKNVDIFRSYVFNVLFDQAYIPEPQISDPASIFIPFGWDDNNKLDILKGMIGSISPDQPLSSYGCDSLSTTKTQEDFEIYPLPNEEEFEKEAKECLNTLSYSRSDNAHHQQAMDFKQSQLVEEKIYQLFGSKIQTVKDFSMHIDSRLKDSLKELYPQYSLKNFK